MWFDEKYGKGGFSDWMEMKYDSTLFFCFTKEIILELYSIHHFQALATTIAGDHWWSCHNSFIRPKYHFKDWNKWAQVIKLNFLCHLSQTTSTKECLIATLVGWLSSCFVWGYFCIMIIVSWVVWPLKHFKKRKEQKNQKNIFSCCVTI